MYLFASILAAVAHYVYFRFIDQGFLSEHVSGPAGKYKAFSKGRYGIFP